MILKLPGRLLASALILFSLISTPALTSNDLPGKSLFLHIKQAAGPFPRSGDYKIDFAATGATYSIQPSGEVFAASGSWTFRLDPSAPSVVGVITLQNYFGDGTGAEIALVNTAYYELYAQTFNQNGNWSLTEFVRDPVIGTHPANATAASGSALSLDVSLLNFESGVTYRWYKNGVPVLTGGASSSLAFSPLDYANAGDYFVVATKGSDSSTSHVARVTVVAPVPASFMGATFELFHVYNAIPLGFPETVTTNAFRLNNITRAEWDGSQLFLLSDYRGNGTNRNRQGTGVFASSNSVLRKLVISTEIAPGGSSPYTAVFSMNHPEEGVFDFFAVYPRPGGGTEFAMFQWNGVSATRLFDTSTPVPLQPGEQFKFFGTPVGRGATALFSATLVNPYMGYYQYAAGQLSKVLDTSDQLPGFASPPRRPYLPSPAALDGNRVVASVTDQDDTTVFGVFQRIGTGPWTTILNQDTIFPGTSVKIASIMRTVEAASGLTAIHAYDDQLREYLLSYDGTTLRTLAKTGDLAGNSPIRAIGNYVITPAGVVFQTTTEDNADGVYLARNGAIEPVLTRQSQIGRRVVTRASLFSGQGTNLVLSATLFPYGSEANLILVNTGRSPLEFVNNATPDANHRLTFNFTGPAGQPAILEKTSDFQNWLPVETNTVSGVVNSASDTAATTPTWEFYRLKTNP